jgi:hypothetical protein
VCSLAGHFLAFGQSVKNRCFLANLKTVRNAEAPFSFFILPFSFFSSRNKKLSRPVMKKEKGKRKNERLDWATILLRTVFS